MVLLDSLKDSLSQVVFIHDYIQLVLGESRLSIFFKAKVELGGRVLSQGEPGFCDMLVSLIGQKIAEIESGKELKVVFEEGATLSVAEDGEGPEAWTVSSLSQPLVVR